MRCASGPIGSNEHTCPEPSPLLTPASQAGPHRSRWLNARFKSARPVPRFRSLYGLLRASSSLGSLVVLDEATTASQRSRTSIPNCAHIFSRSRPALFGHESNKMHAKHPLARTRFDWTDTE